MRLIEEPILINKAKETVYGYLKRIIGCMSQLELCNLLRFITGSSAPLDHPIDICFNSVSGLSRRPIAHTCSFTLEISSTFLTYQEFEKEFKTVLSSEYAWLMDSW